MTKNYIILAYSEESKVVFSDVFTESSERAARKAFNECYRHRTYHILSVTEVPNECDTSRMSS